MKFVLVLLGNKGDVYKATRHNAARILFESIKDIPDGFETLIPQGFMNESGLDVARYMRYHKMVEPIIVYDDKDLEIGRMKIAYDRSDGGHNGLKSVIQCLGRTDFLRLRIGIAPKGTDGIINIAPHGKDVQQYVLATMQKHEKDVLVTLAKNMPKVLAVIRDEGYIKAMEMYNGK